MGCLSAELEEGACLLGVKWVLVSQADWVSSWGVGVAPFALHTWALAYCLWVFVQLALNCFARLGPGACQ